MRPPPAPAALVTVVLSVLIFVAVMTHPQHALVISLGGSVLMTELMLRFARKALWSPEPQVFRLLPRS